MLKKLLIKLAAENQSYDWFDLVANTVYPVQVESLENQFKNIQVW